MSLLSRYCVIRSDVKSGDGPRTVYSYVYSEYGVLLMRMPFFFVLAFETTYNFDLTLW